MDVTKVVTQVVIVAAGVMVAGAIMNALYSQVGFVEYASDGFDK